MMLSQRNLGRFIATLAIGVTAVASIFSTAICWIQITYAAAAFLSLVALVFQILDARVFVRMVHTNDWVTVGDEKQFEITSLKHGKGRYPHAAIDLQTDHGYEECIADVRYGKDGSVTVAIVQALDKPLRVRLS